MRRTNPTLESERGCAKRTQSSARGTNAPNEPNRRLVARMRQTNSIASSMARVRRTNSIASLRRECAKRTHPTARGANAPNEPTPRLAAQMRRTNPIATRLENGDGAKRTH